MEVRQCVSYGPLVEAMKEINRLPSWRQIIGQPKPDKRLRDVELALRCLALSEDGDGYEKPMKGFLNNYMEEKRGLDADYPGLVQRFGEACDYVLGALGSKPFHLRGRLNYGAMDSIMSAALAGLRPQDLQRRFAKLRKNTEYDNAITYNTSDESVVELRLALAVQALSG